MEHKLGKPYIKPFVLAGNSTFTLVDEEKGTRHTYKVKKKDMEDIWFVRVKMGNSSDYKYICYFRNDFHMKMSAKSHLSRSSEEVELFSYLLRNIDSTPDDIAVYHLGKCARCGRTLTVPESIEAGLGPECMKYYSL